MIGAALLALVAFGAGWVVGALLTVRRNRSALADVLAPAVPLNRANRRRLGIRGGGAAAAPRAKARRR